MISQVKITTLGIILVSIIQIWLPNVAGHKIHLSDGTLKLIIRSYVNDLLTKYQPDPNLRSHLHKMSSHVVNHPALYQKRLYIGSEPPTHDPEIEDDQSSMMVMKRKVPKEETPTEQFPSEEICPTNRQWEQINKTHDLYDNEVEVIQEEGMTQFIYTYRCSSNKASSCVGISPLYNSECTERNGWVYMLHKKPGDEAPQWGYVAAPHHCACKIQPKLEVTVPSSER
ncbi:uncharacterized protein LOC107361120 [Tetranychus urticae]|uniref:Nerve growth factor-related domain-containing protein n=1 Tax=Tetranychus urticae TaxID=32264 RepID=T1K725_TETUR|nr:uncharacterized protein LOC107361021 [Tetranychus urticae]XP_015783354.1 uncharacterized protein LOC107361120 [Tetranychus urticae]